LVSVSGSRQSSAAEDGQRGVLRARHAYFAFERESAFDQQLVHP